MDTIIEKRKQALQDLRTVESKIKALHVIDYDDYWEEYAIAFISYNIANLDKSQFEPYEFLSFEFEAQHEYYRFLEDLECEGYCVRW